jgi:hypothetical protein
LRDVIDSAVVVVITKPALLRRRPRRKGEITVDVSIPWYTSRD